jgi:adsorption protein B
MIIAAILIALFILLSALDDLIMDVLYLTTGRKQAHRLTVEELSKAPPQQIAVLIPAWQEGAVIGEMLRTTLQLQRYPQTRYQLFVGVYPNDADTQAAVDAVAARHANVRKVVNPPPGPTTKASNLNAMYQAMTAMEQAAQRRFDVVVMHDAEDVVHPLAFKLYNYLIPAADMAQIPVLPIAPRATLRNFVRYLTAGTYADEFAENHLRHMLVRERFGGFVPSAGVGTALSRRAVDLLAEQGGGNPFLNASLTEDYEMALRLARAGCKTVYFLEGVERVDNAGRIHLEYIATRETFPNEFWQAVKQKTRWIYGITMQNAGHAGWKGSVGQRYLLYRDVKGKFANLLNVPAYLVTVWFGVCFLMTGGFPAAGPVEGPFRALLLANSVLWAERQVVRFLALRQQYGVGEAILSTLLPPLLPLRFLWGSLINLAATIRDL